MAAAPTAPPSVSDSMSATTTCIPVGFNATLERALVSAGLQVQAPEGARNASAKMAAGARACTRTTAKPQLPAWPAPACLVDDAAQLHRRLGGQGPHQPQPALQALQLDLTRVGGAQAGGEQHHQLRAGGWEARTGGCETRKAAVASPVVSRQFSFAPCCGCQAAQAGASGRGTRIDKGACSGRRACLRQEAAHKAARQLGQEQDAAQHGHAGPHVRGRHLRTLLPMLPMLRLLAVVLRAVPAALGGRRAERCGRRQAPVQAVSPVLEHASHVVAFSQKLSHRQLHRREGAGGGQLLSAHSRPHGQRACTTDGTQSCRLATKQVPANPEQQCSTELASWSPRDTWLRFSRVTVARRSTVSGSATPPPQSSALPACGGTRGAGGCIAQ